AEQVPDRLGVLGRQLHEGLAGIDPSDIVLAYEPIWAIGPGKTPPSAEQIAAIAADIKRILPCPLVYGGGLKKENATAIGAIRELDGGLIALTRFTGQIGFHPEEYLEIVDMYFSGANK
ncbi:MAG: triosephosphate isomerase, partial [Syntrophobacteraceae bacterium]|nr:triosephosphate isomerase [Syntrophobacteraceae bacterium]